MALYCVYKRTCKANDGFIHRLDDFYKMSRHRDWDIACKVYIGNLGNNASKYELEDAFSKYGPLKNVWVARNPPGFAFVEFEDPRDAEDSVRGLDGTRVCGVSKISLVITSSYQF